MEPRPLAPWLFRAKCPQWPSNDREHLEKMMESDDEVYELDLWDALNTVQCMDMASPFFTGPGQSFPHVNWSMAVSPFQVPPKPMTDEVNWTIFGFRWFPIPWVSEPSKPCAGPDSVEKHGGIQWPNRVPFAKTESDWQMNHEITWPISPPPFCLSVSASTKSWV